MPGATDLKLLDKRDDLSAFYLLAGVVAEVAVEDHARAARHAFVRGALHLVRVGVLGDFDVVDEGVPQLPLADVEDGVVDDLRGRVDLRARVEGEQAAGGNVVRRPWARQVRVVEVLACERCHGGVRWV